MSMALQLNVDSPHSYSEKRAWLASIQLQFADKQTRTVLKDMQFLGPLRVQRSFYPEQGRNHTYLLHPPGGMVSGDKIQISAELECGAKVLMTTPSAGKVYGADTLNLPQRQNVSLHVQAGAELEWLPQENIVFDGANAVLETQIDLASTSKLIAWDMVSFGRPHGEHWFRKGALEQLLTIRIDGNLVLHEAFRTDPELEVLSSPIGLAGYVHMGNMFIVAPEENAQYKDWIEQLRESMPKPSASLRIAVTERRGVMIVRALCDDIEKLRNTFIQIWERLRPLVLNTEAVAPRIWST